MDTFPFEYQRIPPVTWAYLSSFLILALFFKFNRFWSVRNFDLLLVILLAPGLLLIHGGQIQLASDIAAKKAAMGQNVEASTAEAGDDSKLNLDQEDPNDGIVKENKGTFEAPDTLGHQWQRWGYYWLFGVGAVFLIRMLIDPSLTRRPLLEPNLLIGGLVFFGFSLMILTFANIATSEPTNDDLRGARDAVKLIQREAAQTSDIEQLRKRGPGYRLFNLLPIIPSFNSGNELLQVDADQSENMGRYVIAAKSLAILSQLLVVIGLILFCHYNYNNFNVGVGVATVYLMHPYSAIFTGHVLHTLPAGLIVFALVSFRFPRISGVLIGLATGVSYYPIFLTPLWASFYWQRGVKRFVLGFLIAIGFCVGGLAFTSVDSTDFFLQLRVMFGFLTPMMTGLEGIWALGWNQWWRLPLLVAFVLLSVSFVFWPTEKNIGTLVAYSAAVMIGVQFWHGFGGGLYIAWYLPMVLLIVFRPNLNGRVAKEELRENKKKHKDTAEDILPVG